MSNNSIILNGCIDQFKKNNELTKSESELFELFALTQITKALDVSFEEIEKGNVDGGSDGGIDNLMVLVDDLCQESIEDLDEAVFSPKTTLTILISQCKKEKSFKEGAIDKLIATIPELFNLEKSEDALLIRFNPDLVEQALLAREAWKRCAINGGKIRVHFSYCCIAEIIEINSAFTGKVEQLIKLTTSQFTGAVVTHANFSSAELLKLYQTHRNQRLALEFKDQPLSTSYTTNAGNHGIGYVGTVKLADYKEFLSDEDGTIRDDLFESNIRHFQGQVDVNKKIKATVGTLDKKDFWWLNNGITIIASNPKQVGKTLSLDNVQIVNGLQTSYSIFNNHSGDKTDNRSVLVKVIINEDKETIDHIIASTNSQNPVSPALLRATDDIQRDLELFFVNSGYFYDRRKNYYKNIGKPAAKIFSIQTAAQAIESVINHSPFAARSKPTSLIKDDTTYERIFNPKINFNVYLNCCLILKCVNENMGIIHDPASRAKITNFKLHLARILTSVVLKKPTYNHKDVEMLDLNTLGEENFTEAVTILINSIDSFRRVQDTNLINMSKTKGFTDHIIETIKAQSKQLNI